MPMAAEFPCRDSRPRRQTERSPLLRGDFPVATRFHRAFVHIRPVPGKQVPSSGSTRGQFLICAPGTVRLEYWFRRLA